MAALGEQLARQVQIGAPVIGGGLVAEVRPFREGQAVHRAAAAEERRLHHVVAPDRIGDRLAQLHVGERALRAVEVEIHEGAVDDVHRLVDDEFLAGAQRVQIDGG